MGKKLILILLVTIVAAAAVLVWRMLPAGVPPVVLIATTLPTTRPAATQVAIVPQITTYMDEVRAANPDVPATQPLAMVVDLPDAAHLVLHDPVYLDRLGHLWITRGDAPPAERSLRNPVDSSEHIIPERPVFVHWSINDNGDWSAFIVARNPRGRLEIISSLDRRTFPAAHSYRWENAFSWDGKIVVPTDVGVSVFEVEPQLVEHYHALRGMKLASADPVVMLDSRGVLAWAPWDNGRPGSQGVCRFVDGDWTDLSAEQWPDKPVQFVPLLDGSILQIAAGEGDKISVSIAPLESSGIDEHHVAELVDLLSDRDGDKRQSAFDELSRYGPGLWPLLEKVTDQPAEARIRIRQLLRGKITPALNGMTVVENRLSVINRQADGTVLFFAPLGVKIPDGDRDPLTVVPAWVAIHSNGRIDRPLPAHLIADQLSTASHVYCVHEEWVVCDDNGVRRYFGNALVPLLKPAERMFKQVLGVDRRGRWLFRQPGSSSTDTLLIDPTVLDPTPKLPVWTMTINNGSVGWTADDYPVIKRGGAWALKADTWEALPDKTKILTDATTLRPMVTTRPASAPVGTSGAPLLVTKEGDNYFDGKEALVIVDRSGRITTWPLPAAAIGSGETTLIRTADGLLFLFNQPGRVLRIKPTPGELQPFKLDATFTTNIPNSAHPMRIWLDPLGRMNFVYDNNVLAVMFPAGRIPPEIAQMMLDN